MKTKMACLVILLLGLLASCNDGKVYDEYRHTPLMGWEKNDTLSFGVGRVKRAGNFEASLGLRIDGSYPFTSLTLLVEYETLPSHEHGIDTLTDERCRTLNIQKGCLDIRWIFFKIREPSFQIGCTV